MSEHSGERGPSGPAAGQGRETPSEHTTPAGGHAAPTGGRAPRTGDAELTRRGQRVELTSAGFFGAAMVAAIALAVVYWKGGQVQAEGVLLAVVFAGIGVGIVLWAKHFMPSDEVTEERHRLASTEDQVAAFTESFEAGESSLRSRRLLVAMGGGACAALGVALLFPVRSLGPRPGSGLKRTAYAGQRKRVVREDGSPVRPADIARGGAITVWPAGHTNDADAPTLLIRIRGDQRFETRTREDWVVDGDIVAYSKLCTHVGCPVGLYQAGSALLLCPCHQSTFNVLDGAKPVFGPAARSLPQLPLGLDDDGYIVATGDFADPVGPGFWDRGR